MNKDALNGKYCDYNNFKRARYFNGMLMTDRDFREEQIYLIEKRKMLNRMLHGWGVVCGLKVKPTNIPGPNVIVEPGMALDCHGNEILVCAEQTINLTLNPCSPTQTNTQKDPCASYSTTNQTSSALYVVIKYQEVPSDPVPVYAPGGSCTDKTCEQSRIHEGFCIEVWDQLPISPQPGTTDWPCKEPFPCPPSVNCPDPHYILLATISCGPRIDSVFSKCTITDTSSNLHEIRCHIKRSLSRVCISNTNPNDNGIDINDTYVFDTDLYFYNTFEWKINWDKLEDGSKFKSDNTGEVTSSNIAWNIGYKITAISGAEVGPSYMKIPVSLIFYDETGKPPIGTCDLMLQSPIDIGPIEPKRGSTISAAMIRNIEQRTFVTTFPMLSWLLTSTGREEGQLLSGDVNLFCKLMEKQIQGHEMRTQIQKMSDRVNKLENDIKKAKPSAKR
jgi:hypothetical protein